MNVSFTHETEIGAILEIEGDYTPSFDGDRTDPPYSSEFVVTSIKVLDDNLDDKLLLELAEAKFTDIADSWE